MKLKKLVLTGIALSALLSGCSQNPQNITVQSEDGSHSANIQMTADGVKVEAPQPMCR